MEAHWSIIVFKICNSGVACLIMLLRHQHPPSAPFIWPLPSRTPEFETSKDPMIQMDCMAFGMGCCCLQVTEPWFALNKYAAYISFIHCHPLSSFTILITLHPFSSFIHHTYDIIISTSSTAPCFICHPSMYFQVTFQARNMNESRSLGRNSVLDRRSKFILQWFFMP